jgi:hypothetical protein
MMYANQTKDDVPDLLAASAGVIGGPPGPVSAAAADAGVDAGVLAAAVGVGVGVGVGLGAGGGATPTTVN